MSRLLFAAARGARIERLWFKYKDEPHNWEICKVFSVANESDYELRIHPDDLHLQYGPISTDLLNTASYELTENQFPSLGLYAAMACYLDGLWHLEWVKQNTGTRALAILILAEALADEGL